MNIPLPPEPPVRPFRGVLTAAVLDRVAGPYLLFSAFLAGILILSWLFLLPRFTTVSVNGGKRTASDIIRYRTELLGQVQENETLRLQHVLSLYDPQYTFLKTSRSGNLGFERLMAEVQAQAEAVAPAGSVHIANVQFDPAKHLLTLTGDVRSVGSRSMTVLAAFADALGKSGSVASIEPPQFTRDDDPVIGPHSPFTLHLTLR